MSRRPPTFYVLHGTDEFSCRAALQSLRAQMGDESVAELNITVLDGKQTTAADVLAAASAMPFLADKRMVIVEGMLTWLARKGAGKAARDEVAALVEGLPELPDFARVVFVEPDTLPAQNAVLAGDDRAQRLPQSLQPTRDPARWIVQQAQTVYDTAIEPAAAAALAAVVGDDLVPPTASWRSWPPVNGERAISTADVALLTPYVAEADVFEWWTPSGGVMGRPSRAAAPPARRRRPAAAVP